QGFFGRIQAGEFADVGTGAKAGLLARLNDQACRRPGSQHIENLVQFVHDLPGQPVDRAVHHVKGQPRNVLAVNFKGEMANAFNGAVCHACAPEQDSSSMAPPWPPPMQMAAMPRLSSLSLRVLRQCSTMRAPDAPTGWPMAMAPPLTLSVSMLSSPNAGCCRCCRHQSSSCQAARQASTWSAKASLISQRSTSSSDSWCRISMGLAAMTGPRPMRAGSSAAHWVSMMRPSGCRLCSSTALADATSSMAAPSVTCELLPAVILPQGGSNTALRLPSRPGVEPSRTPSSTG